MFVINGNHDLGNDCATGKNEFKKIYAEFGYDLALETDENSCSYTVDLGENYRLIALDSCDFDKHTEDGLTVKNLILTRQQIQCAKEDGRYPVLMMHHNLLEHMPVQSVISSAFIVRNYMAVAEMLADWGVRLVFTGHEHCSDAAVFTSALGNKIYDFATTSLTMYPLQYRLFTLSDSEIRYESKTVDSIDTEALSRDIDGYSAEQLEMMNRGMNSYAFGFFKAGVKYRLLLSLSPEKLGISEDDIYYELVMTAVNGLTGILEMPFYGDDSVQTLAGSFGIEIPSSDYENGWELVTTLAAAHYAGSEAYTLESTEVTLLLRTAALLLRTELSAVNDVIFKGAGDSIFTASGIAPSGGLLSQAACALGYSITPGEYFIIAVLSPLLYGFSYDSDGVDDNNGTLPAYSQPSVQTNAENIKKNIGGIFDNLFGFFKLFIARFMKMFG